ncbi:MAG: peptide chain release factor N(5)-glutamine methyltransferase [Candidatus Sericytochromatia bacterium]|nr:peptide chain release factor N(5)-glutamine methyltransferase [Candidatus Sericytochromatia bacterium]
MRGYKGAVDAVTHEEPGLPTIGDALYQSSKQLLSAGIDTGSLEASLLLGRATGLDRLRLINHTADELSTDDWRCFQGLLKRRLAREPLQYILGETEFMGMRFAVAPSVLIPRPDTETLVEAILDLEEEHAQPRPVHIADIGTGSGIIAITLVKSLPYLQAIASDISSEALDVARLNAEAHRVTDHIEFRQADGLAALAGPVHYLISNPPYIAEDELANLEPEVRDHEPIAALTPGPDALRWYKVFAHEGAAFVEPGGYLALEVGAGQAGAVLAELAASGFWETPTVKSDLGGIARVILARRRPAG